MSRAADREEQVRLMLDGPHPQVPAELSRRAAERGGRLLRRRLFFRRLMTLVACVAVVAFAVWAARTHPWEVPPAETTPLDGW
ncbi:hypothetical protein AB0467_17850 [Streptomyces sp. NPDC052095]|uniref:hypothetical protein n=1 Tax=unclassified Streptomyces TaxID=2593676 RepID=UPI00344B3948